MSDIEFERWGAVPLDRVEVVYVDCRVALQRAYDLGLAAGAEVRTTAPGMLVDDTVTTVQADRHMTPSDIRAMDAAFTALHRACQGAFGDADEDLIAARYATLEFQNPAYKAALLEADDFVRPVAVIELSSRDPDLDRMIRSPMKRLLAANPDLTNLSVPIETLLREDDPRAPSPTFIQRLWFSGLETILYRLVEQLSTRWRLRGPRGRFVVLRENELCKEAAWSMILRGFLPVTLPVAVPFGDADMEEPPAYWRTTIRALLDEHIGPFLRAEAALDPLTDMFEEAVNRRVRRFRKSLDVWPERLDGLLKPGQSAVLTNWVNDPELIGLKKALEPLNVPMVFFQHGVTNEINWRMRQYEAQFGTSLCDLEMAFNHRAADLSMNNPFLRGRAVATGFPKDYYRGMRRTGAVEGDGPPIWYVCTAFYVANHGQLEGVTDWDKCQHESAIVTEVLAKCRHRVVFKPYPGRRYEDPDPIETAVEASDNIDMHRTRLDLRYVVRHARVLISARSFSTPSWCLATDLPLIHIDIPDQDPLDDAARPAFDAGVFLFDASAPDFHAKLLAFLNEPIEEIERQWAEKAPERKELMTGFMSSYTGGAGGRAAREIVREMAQRRR